MFLLGRCCSDNKAREQIARGGKTDGEKENKIAREREREAHDRRASSTGNREGEMLERDLPSVHENILYGEEPRDIYAGHYII